MIFNFEYLTELVFLFPLLSLYASVKRLFLLHLGNWFNNFGSCFMYRLVFDYLFILWSLIYLWNFYHFFYSLVSWCNLIRFRLYLRSFSRLRLLWGKFLLMRFRNIWKIQNIFLILRKRIKSLKLLIFKIHLLDFFWDKLFFL